jgi:uncharacterized repeat protein (TIGR01451 family)
VVISGISNLVLIPQDISRDGINYDPTNPANRSLRGVIATTGVQTIPWDGKDNIGTNFPVGSNYNAVVRVHAGEYHFPLIDAENMMAGGVTVEVLNGANAGSNIAFYDDRGYQTVNVYDNAGTLVKAGQLVGTINSVLTGNSPPSTAYSNPLSGYSSTSTQRSYGDGTASGFGDAKGLDLWTYLSSNSVNTTLNILAIPPALPLVKRITAVRATALADLNDQIGGANDTNDNNLLWPTLSGTAIKSNGTGNTSSFSTFLKGKIDASNLLAVPSDEVEYTIYFLSSGGQTARGASICDFIPVNTTYVANSLTLVKGVAPSVSITDGTVLDTDGGAYPIGTAQSAMPAACRTAGSTDTTRGAIVVNIGDIPNATASGNPGTSYGYIRFRVKLN